MNLETEHLGVIERQLGEGFTRMASELDRIAHAVEAIATNLDPNFKTLIEENRAKRARLESRSPGA